ncbi:MAG: arylsulfatase [Pirellulaceae bacterium]|nr:arylsulfatase [Pirellulaceae bacterium]
MTHRSLRSHHLVFALVCCLVAPILDAAERPPNVIYLLADDLGYAELGCYGQKWIKTPHIDRIAHEGIRFTNHYSGNAVCAPSRCNLMTGKHPGHAFIRNNGNPPARRNLGTPEQLYFPGQFPIPSNEVTIQEMLKQKKYATAAIGKWGLGFEGSTGDPNRQGVDLFYGFLCQVHAHNHYPKFLWHLRNGNAKKEMLSGNDRTLHGKTYSQDRFIDVALEFIDQNKDRPFFLYMPFAIPHLSIQAPEASVNEYKDVIPEEAYKHRGYLPHPTPRAGYAAMVTHMDRGVGQIMARVAELGLDANTLIIFTSDNGPTYNRLGGSDSDFFASAGNFRGLKGSLYEGGIRVPMVARWPGKIKAESVTDLPSAFWDVMPTIAEITGTTPPEKIDGISFAPTLLGELDRQEKHEYLYWEFAAYGGQQAVRQGNWKAIRQNMLKKSNQDPLQTELYDLANDIGEQRNVAAQHPDVIAKLNVIMQQARTPSDLFAFGPLDELESRQ